jgi:AcrR family transcriptional regulator
MEARADAVNDTRERILAAARTMFFENWYDEVTLSGIASSAGVSHQTVLNHFGSKDGVLSALVEQQQAEVITLRDVTPGDTPAAVAALMVQYEIMGLANVRATAVEHRVPALHEALQNARTWHREWVERTFAHALPASGASRRHRIAAYLAATEVASWKSLRHDYGFSARDTAAAILTLVTALEAQR